MLQLSTEHNILLDELFRIIGAFKDHILRALLRDTLAVFDSQNILILLKPVLLITVISNIVVLFLFYYRQNCSATNLVRPLIPSMCFLYFGEFSLFGMGNGRGRVGADNNGE